MSQNNQAWTVEDYKNGFMPGKMRLRTEKTEERGQPISDEEFKEEYGYNKVTKESLQDFVKEKDLGIFENATLETQADYVAAQEIFAAGLGGPNGRGNAVTRLRESRADGLSILKKLSDAGKFDTDTLNRLNQEGEKLKGKDPLSDESIEFNKTIFIKLDEVGIAQNRPTSEKLLTIVGAKAFQEREREEAEAAATEIGKDSSSIIEKYAKKLRGTPEAAVSKEMQTRLIGIQRFMAGENSHGTEKLPENINKAATELMEMSNWIGTQMIVDLKGAMVAADRTENEKQNNMARMLSESNQRNQRN